MRFAILGPLQVHDGITPLSLGGGHQRKLLALLLLHANQPVSSDRLIEELWGGRPPETAAKALQGLVSQLRKQLGTATVETVSGGYLVRIDDGDLDALRFEQLLRDARRLENADALAALHEALSLWRGPALADFAYDDFARGEIERLEELRETCIERRIELELALGRHDDLVPELEALVREHPLRERLRHQLMLALYRSGRQAEALETYRDARRVLRDELGLDPGDDLQELQKAILAHDPAIAAPPRAAEPAGDGRRRRRRLALILGSAGALVLAAAIVGAVALRDGGGASTVDRAEQLRRANRRDARTDCQLRRRRPAPDRARGRRERRVGRECRRRDRERARSRHREARTHDRHRSRRQRRRDRLWLGVDRRRQRRDRHPNRLGRGADRTNAAADGARRTRA